MLSTTGDALKSKAKNSDSYIYIYIYIYGADYSISIYQGN
jgi:hypothetical protein